jgi:hypothetical protein
MMIALSLAGASPFLMVPFCRIPGLAGVCGSAILEMVERMAL